MNAEYNYNREKNFLYVSIKGKYSFNDIIDILSHVRNQCIQHSITRVLVNCNLSEGSVSTTDKYKIGVFISETFTGKIKLAIVDELQNISKLSETVAVNRGGNVSIFVSYEEAVAWLLNSR